MPRQPGNLTRSRLPRRRSTPRKSSLRRTQSEEPADLQRHPLVLGSHPLRRQSSGEGDAHAAPRNEVHASDT